MICLSTTVRNDTLQDAKEQRVSVKCRKQLRVEEVEMVCSLTGSQSEVTSGLTFQRVLVLVEETRSRVYVWVCGFHEQDDSGFLDQHTGLSAVNTLLKLVLMASCLFFFFSSWT